MTEFTVAVRLVHFAAAVALFGELAFVAWIAPSAGESRKRTLRVAACSLALVLVSGFAWLAVDATRVLSYDQETSFISLLCPVYINFVVAFSGSHTRTVVSAEPEAIQRPSGDQATDVTLSVCS